MRLNSDLVSADIIYGASDGHTLPARLRDLRILDDLARWDSKKWLRLLDRYVGRDMLKVHASSALRLKFTSQGRSCGLISSLSSGNRQLPWRAS